MNRIYRKVWNKALGQLVVASELASSDSSGGVVDQRRDTTQATPALLAVALGLVLGLGMSSSAAARSVQIGGSATCVALSGKLLEKCLVEGTASARAATRWRSVATAAPVQPTALRWAQAQGYARQHGVCRRCRQGTADHQRGTPVPRPPMR